MIKVNLEKNCVKHRVLTEIEEITKKNKQEEFRKTLPEFKEELIQLLKVKAKQKDSTEGYVN
jgi:hypothetical protein